MSTIKVHAGDFRKDNPHFLMDGKLKMYTEKSRWKAEYIPLDQLASVELASEESVKKVGGTIGWGAVGGLALGPVGLLAGLLLGGKGKDVTFVATFKDGRKMLATIDSKSYTKLQAAVF